jgi:hypothetical protein
MESKKREDKKIERGRKVTAAFFENCSYSLLQLMWFRFP